MQNGVAAEETDLDLNRVHLTKFRICSWWAYASVQMKNKKKEMHFIDYVQ